MNRVAVVGCPGSGKTHFSRKLAQLTGLPLVHLDRLYHDTSFPEDPNEKRRLWLAQVETMCEQLQWITDGNYKSSLDLRLPQADTIVMLDYPRYLVLYRLLKRRVEFRNNVRVDMPEGWKEKIQKDFFLFVWSFKKRYRPQLISKIEKLANNREVVFLQSPRQAEEYLASLHS